jgi:Skp family chaperone for outer membrane proteins
LPHRESSVRNFSMYVMVLVAVVMGCDGAPDNKPTTTPAPAHAEVGVVDFERVFKELGWVDEINSSLQKTKAEYAQKIQSFKGELDAALKTTRTRIADAAQLNKKQREDLENGRDLDKLPLTGRQWYEHEQSKVNIVQGLQGFAGRADQLLQIWQNQMVSVCRESMQPSVRRVSEAAGVSIVLNSAQVPYFGSTVNLTNKVIDDLRSAPPPRTLPDPPTLEIPKIQIATPEPSAAPTGKPSTRTSTRSTTPPQK